MIRTLILLIGILGTAAPAYAALNHSEPLTHTTPPTH